MFQEFSLINWKPFLILFCLVLCLVWANSGSPAKIEDTIFKQNIRYYTGNGTLSVTGGDLDGIREEARAFFAPTRYVLAHLIDAVPMPGLTIEWRSTVPVSSGLGSGAAATSAMALGVLTLAGKTPTSRELIDFAWQGDVIAHGGIASALDSSTIVYGGLVSYAVDTGASPFCVSASLPLVIGNTHVADRSTAKLNTRVRKWLEGHPAKRHLFPDMGYLVDGIAHALKDNDLETLGHLLNLHQLIQDKLGTSAPENEALIEAAIGAGALGAKISGAGGGGIIVALARPGSQNQIAEAIADAGGDSYIATTGAAGVRTAIDEDWQNYSKEQQNR